MLGGKSIWECQLCHRIEIGSQVIHPNQDDLKGYLYCTNANSFFKTHICPDGRQGIMQIIGLDKE